VAGLLLGLLGLLQPGSAAGARYQPRARGEAVTVPVGHPAKSYLLLGDEPLVIPLVGPGELTGYVRIHCADAEDAAKQGRLILLGLAGTPAVENLEFRPSSETAYADTRDGRPSAGRKLTWEIPAGEHELELRAQGAGGSPMFAILYYEGPPQPLPPAAPIVTAPRAQRRDPLDVRASVGLQIIYDSNILNNSDDYRDEWGDGTAPWKFRLRTEDDLVLSPSLDVELRRQVLGWGQTRLGISVQTWQYCFNPIKDNTEIASHLRQYLGGSRSLEIAYLYAPMQYIRQLSDREAFSDPDLPLLWRGFLFSKNVTTITYRQRLNRSFSGKILVENNLRYYNRPFLENDIDAWEIRGNLVWRAHRRLDVSLDYSYEDAAARAVDSVGETPLISDDSDASYVRDLYRLGLTWEPRFLRPWVDQIDVVGLLMLYWYTTDKDLFEDPYHAGRRDSNYRLSLELRRHVSRKLTVRLGTFFTERAVDSPWPGDVALDKDFTKQRYWLRLDYDL